MRGKTLACSLVLVGGLWFGQDPEDDKPYGYKDKTGYSMAQTFLGTGSSNPYSDATACWSFNAQDGTDDCAATYTLTEVNTPTYTGGALGYAMYSANGAARYASINDNATLSIGPGVSFGFALWTRADAADVKILFARGDGVATEGEFDVYTQPGTAWACRFKDDTGANSDTTGAIAIGQRVFIACRYNATTNSWEAGLDGSWSGSPESMSSDGADDGNATVIGAYSAGGSPYDGTIGPVWWYRSSSGGEVLTDAYFTSLYNSGKGKTCADTTETTNLISCWNMTEDGGPYVDSIGSNNLTGVNTPTRGAGLVERSDSGMTVRTVASTSTALNNSGELDDNTAFTLAAWFFDNKDAEFPAARVDSGGSGAIVLYGGGATPYALMEAYDGGWKNTGGYNGAWTAGGWHHVCGDVTWGTGIRIFVDGTQHSTTTAIGSRVDLTDLVEVGRNRTGGYENTTADDVAVWKGSAVCDTKASSIYNSGVGTFYAAYLDFFMDERQWFAWALQPEQRRIYVR